jgi:hypothetical protein
MTCDLHILLNLIGDFQIFYAWAAAQPPYLELQGPQEKNRVAWNPNTKREID